MDNSRFRRDLVQFVGLMALGAFLGIAIAALSSGCTTIDLTNSNSSVVSIVNNGGGESTPECPGFLLGAATASGSPGPAVILDLPPGAFELFVDGTSRGGVRSGATIGLSTGTHKLKARSSCGAFSNEIEVVVS